MGFHAAGGIDRVAPEVVDELGPADHPGDDRSRVDADAHPKRQAVVGRAALNLGPHGQAHVRDRIGVIVPWERNAARHHVSVPDRLDLLHPVAGGQCVPAGEDAVQQRHHLRGREPLGQFGEANNVGEQHSGLQRRVGDDAPVVFETPRHRLRQYVEQQRTPGG